ncbi:MAG: DNA polymerase IV [Clostridiales bacterium]|nr:DNA polymerase IV [Clostridiales bacterium]
MEKRERVILHSDLNNFFASVEVVLNPELKGKPIAVCGDPKERHGIVLAKSEEAKKFGIKTAETVYSALRKCPELVLVGSHFHEYKRYSGLVRQIYERYTEKIEECSIDECALDMTESTQLFGSGAEIAEKIRQQVKEELGVTVSVGVSFNKAFAKLASELKKPDAVTVITKENYKRVVHPLPVSELMFVGKSTEETLHKIGIYTIGDLANADEELINRKLGKRGRQLHIYACGEDEEPVKWQKTKEDLKSIGNSTTLPKDITDREEIKRWFYALAESVTARQRDADVGRANTVHIVIRNDQFQDFTWQTKIFPTALCGDIAKTAYDLFCQHAPYGIKVRMLGITVSGFDYHIEQLTLDAALEGGESKYEKKERAENAVAKIREKYGYAKLQRGIVLEDEKLNGLDIRGKKEDTSVKEKTAKTKDDFKME